MGLVHLYYGEGKGKSTAAAGLALRALGAGFCVTIVRLLKSGEAESAEADMLEKNGARIINGKKGRTFVSRMSESEKEGVRSRQDEILTDLLEELPETCENEDRLIILDEALAACNFGLLDEELLKSFVAKARKTAEIVLTGRDPKEWMLKEADYITEFCCKRHPYDKGITARKGIEY